MKKRLANLAEFLTSKRAWVLCLTILAVTAINNDLAVICATLTGNVYIICKTIEQRNKQ